MTDMEQSYHYRVMRRAIELIDRDGETMSLDDMVNPLKYLTLDQ